MMWSQSPRNFLISSKDLCCEKVTVVLLLVLLSTFVAQVSRLWVPEETYSIDVPIPDLRVKAPVGVHLTNTRNQKKWLGSFQVKPYMKLHASTKNWKNDFALVFISSITNWLMRHLTFSSYGPAVSVELVPVPSSRYVSLLERILEKGWLQVPSIFLSCTNGITTWRNFQFNCHGFNSSSIRHVNDGLWRVAIAAEMFAILWESVEVWLSALHAPVVILKNLVVLVDLWLLPGWLQVPLHELQGLGFWKITWIPLSRQDFEVVLFGIVGTEASKHIKVFEFSYGDLFWLKTANLQLFFKLALAPQPF